MAPPTYLVDSDVFITAKNLYYAFDICPGFWRSILHRHGEGRVFSIDRVPRRARVCEWPDIKVARQARDASLRPEFGCRRVAPLPSGNMVFPKSELESDRMTARRVLPRRVERSVHEALDRQAAVGLIGPRQVGKTTLAWQIAESRDALYLDLESSADRIKLGDPNLFLGEYEDRLVVLDEIHRAPGLFRDLRGLIDRGRRRGRRHGRFLILGSAGIDLLRQSGESLAGRIEYVELGPVDVLEIAGEALPLNSLWLRGGFPDSLLADSDADSLALRQSFVRTYLHRDVFDLTDRRLPAETLERLWTMLAHGQGTVLNASKLAASLAVSAPTVSTYVDLLVDLMLVRRLPPVRANVAKRLVKSPRVYVRDSGLVHALLGIADHNALAGHPVCGASWEGFVLENLLAAAPQGTRAGFYRARSGAEIDLVLELPGEDRPWAVEIKRALAPRPSRGLYHAREDVKPGRTWIVGGGAERYPVARGIEVIGLAELSRLLAGQRWQAACPASCCAPPWA